MGNDFTPRKAQKQAVKLKMAIQGPSGSGKTEGALALATNFAPNAKILLIDTENESASLYADRYDFDTIPLTAPYTSQRYVQAMQAAVAGGYDVLIVDSITQQWDGEGGILRRKEEKDRGGGNSFTNWASFTPEHTRFMEFIKQIPVHTIVTMRSKQAYVLEKNNKGKEVPRKVGLDPIQREGTEYEYTIVFEVNMAHRATTSKNRTTLFQGDDPIDLTSPKTAADIKAWLANGVLLPRPAGDVAGQVVDEVERQKTVPLARRFDPAGQDSGHDPLIFQPAIIPPELDWSYQKTTGVLICRLVSVESRKKKGGKGEYLTIKVNGQVGGKFPDVLTYFHNSHRELLLAAAGKVVKLEIEVKGDFANVLTVLEVAGIHLESAESAEPAESDETKARLLASTLDFDEENIRELYTRYSNNNWSEVLVRLEAEKLRREDQCVPVDA